MAFDAVLNMTPSGVAIITLSGELDGTVADKFRAEIQKAADQEARRLVLMVKDLVVYGQRRSAGLDFCQAKNGIAGRSVCGRAAGGDPGSDHDDGFCPERDCIGQI